MENWKTQLKRVAAPIAIALVVILFGLFQKEMETRHTVEMEKSTKMTIDVMLEKCNLEDDNKVILHIEKQLCVRCPTLLDPDRNEGIGPIDPPLKAVKDGLVNGGELSPQYPHFEQAAQAARKAIKDVGQVDIYLSDQGHNYWINMSYHVEGNYIMASLIDNPEDFDSVFIELRKYQPAYTLE